MIRMILADDEPIITKGLSKLLPWEELGIRIIGTCADGDAAMQAILKEQPELALLDISMPGQSGIEILKSIRKLELPTRVILISGFQDFTYAKDAVRYGASDYLLKPVVEEELLGAIRKVLHAGENSGAVYEDDPLGSTGETGTGVAGECLPLMLFLELQKMTRQEKKLHTFAFAAKVREYCKDYPQVQLYPQEDDLLLLIPQMDKEQIRETITKAMAQNPFAGKGRVCFIIGDKVQAPIQPKSLWEALCTAKKQLFFHDEPVAILYEKPEEDDTALESLSRLREAMMNDLMTLKEERFAEDFGRFAEALKRAAGGRKEDANYYFCSSVRLLEEKLSALQITGKAPDTKSLLEGGRSAETFAQMRAYFADYFASYTELIKASAQKEEQKDIQKIKAYIEGHYRENLTLDVMAGEFYMNPYYFSSYFKKQTGVGFKEYVSYIRLQHAISLLVTTSMKTYEIATQVGFSDARAFSDAFTKKYGETPAAYKKRILADQSS